jgi:hypothetical protein
MLGHLSKQRNTETLALEAVQEAFDTAGVDLDFRLEVAPRYEESKAVRIE